MKYVVQVEGRQYRIEFCDDQVLVDDVPIHLDVRQIGDLPLYSLLIGNESAEVSVEEDGRSQYRVMLAGELYTALVHSEDELGAKRHQPTRRTDGVVRAPMPGLVAALPVQAGQTVSAGQTVVVLESMKMENPLQAPASGVVLEVHVHVGDTVERNQPVVTLRLGGAAEGQADSHGDGGTEDG